MTGGVRDVAPVTLEITLASPDVRHVEHVLPHQLRAWAAQVSEILCVVDLLPVPGRPDRSWERDGQRLLDLVDRCCAEYPHAHRRVVDYGADAARALSDAFFFGSPIPPKTYRGGPFYAYLWGWHEAVNDYVFHLDSDIMFGGGSQTWVHEAIGMLRDRPNLLVCQPFPGPPTADGGIYAAGAEHEPGPVPAFRFRTITTRYFLIDRGRFRERIGGLTERAHSPFVTKVGLLDWLHGLRAVPFRDRLRPLRLVTPRVDLPERLLGEAMTAAGMYRLDYLGRERGMWTLHPLERTEAYYECLPELVARIERGEVTDAQRGHYDLDASMLTPA